MDNATQICVVSTVGRISETPIRLWLETMLQVGYKVAVIMPQIEGREMWMSDIQIVSLPSVPYFWPNNYFLQTLKIFVREL